MFGSQNTYGEYNHSYGNAPYYPPPSTDQFWGNKQQNRMNHRNHDPVLASDSLYNPYAQQPLDGPINHIESGISGLNLNQAKQHEDFGSSTFAGSLGSRKTTTWASIASQPAKSQPKSLKSKMAASGLTGSTSKHLPPTVTMDAMSWESKNGSMNNAPSGGKSLPPPAVIANSSVPPPPMTQSSASSIEDLPSPVIQAQPQQSPPQRPAPAASQANKGQENFWASNGNSSSSGSLSTSASSPRPTQAPINLSGNSISKVNNNNSNSNNSSNNNNRGYHRDSSEINENYNPNKYANQRNNNYSKPIDNQPYASAKSAVVHSSARDIPNSPPADEEDDDSASHPVVEKLYVENDYNPKEFDLSPRNARFFIIKSYSEDDVHRSIKYSIWCSTDHGNKRLDTAFRQQEDKGPIYLLYSVNRSGHFCGVAQMMSHVDYNASSGVWAQDKWKGQFQVKWIYVKDVPNDELRHITLENNENKPVTNSRDTQEVPYEKGKKVLHIIHNFDHRTSIFDDFLHYEKKQEEEGMGRKSDSAASPPPPSNYSKMSNSQFNSGMPPRDGQPYRGNASFNKPRSYPDPRDSRDGRSDYDYRNEYRNEPRSDYRPERNDYRNERMERPSDYGRDHRERNADHRNEYRESHIRDNREYRDYREPPQFGREQPYRDFQPPPNREYARERNEYRPPDRDHRDFRDHRDRPDNRDRNHHERQQSWRN